MKMTPPPAPIRLLFEIVRQSKSLVTNLQKSKEKLKTRLAEYNEHEELRLALIELEKAKIKARVKK